MPIADRRWYEATPAAAVAVPAQLGSAQGHHPSPYQSATYQLHPLPSAHLLAVAGVVSENRLLGVAAAKPVPAECEASLVEQFPPPLAKAV
jgi:hypothetical protein